MQEIIINLLYPIFAIFIHKPPTYLHKGTKKDVILIIPGLNNWWLLSLPLAHYLHKRGYSIYIYDDKNNGYGSFTETTHLLNTYIKKLTKPPTILIGHSRGGLIARYYKTYGVYKDAIHTLITIATPHQGLDITHITGNFGKANLSVFDNTKGALDALYKSKKVHNIYAKNDIVIGNTSYIQEMHNYKLSISGHNYCLFSSEFYKQLQNILSQQSI